LADNHWSLGTFPATALETWVQALVAARRRPNTIHSRIAATMQYLDFLAAHGYAVAPHRTPAMPRPRHDLHLVLSRAELDAYDALAARVHQPVGSAMRLLGLCSLRVRELCNLRLEDIHVSDTGIMLHVTSQMAKTGEARLVPTPQAFGPVLRTYMAWRAPIKSVWLFPSTDPSKPIATALIQLQFRKIRKHMGLPGMTPHTLRRTWLTWLHRSGVDLITIQRIAGHHSLHTTTQYITPSIDTLLRAMNKPLGGR